jgi:hypothetical protein
MSRKIEIRGKTIEHNTPDVGDIFLGILTGGITLVPKLIDDKYTVTFHTNIGNIKGSGETLEEAEKKAYNKLKEKL